MKNIWQNRDFVWLVSGQTLSQFGSSISNFAIPWLFSKLPAQPLKWAWPLPLGLFRICFCLFRHECGPIDWIAKK